MMFIDWFLSLLIIVQCIILLYNTIITICENKIANLLFDKVDFCN